MKPKLYDVFVNGAHLLTGTYEKASSAASALMAQGRSVWLTRKNAFQR